jgi:hypothetical protein
VSGLWHGADWKYVVWGSLHGAYYLVWSLMRPSRVAAAAPPKSWFATAGAELIGIATTFALVTLAFVFFRADSIGHAYSYLVQGLTHPLEPIEGRSGVALAYVFPLVAVEWVQRNRDHGLDIKHVSTAGRWALYLVTALAIVEFGNFGEVHFIYFQF